MYVVVNKRNGVEYVSVCESYRDENGKVRHRTIERFGRLDKQLERNPKFLEELKAKYAEERDARNKAVEEKRLKAAEICLSGENSESDVLPLLHFGNLALRGIWKNVLGMDEHFAYLQKEKVVVHYDLNQAASYLTFMKALDTPSFSYGYGVRSFFLGAPARRVSLDDCCDCYARLEQCKNDIVRHLSEKLGAIYEKDKAAFVFYKAVDVRRGFYLASEDITEFDRLMCGLKSVSLALILNQRGIPIDFEVYEGGASELQAAFQSIERLQNTYGVGGAVAVAGGDANAGDLPTLLGKKIGFLKTHDVTKLDASTTATMLDLNGYLPVSESRQDLGLYRAVHGWKEPGKGARAAGCTLVFIWSEAKQKRDEALLNQYVEIVKRKAEGKKIGSTRKGWRQIAIFEGEKILGVDEEEVAKRRKLCGFTAVFHKKSAQKGEGAPSLSGAEIAGAYLLLDSARKCFAVMENHLTPLPPCDLKLDHLQGYAMVRFLSLLLLRILQERLEKTGMRMSVENLVAALTDAMILPLKSGKDVFFLLGGLHPLGNTAPKRNGLQNEEVLERTPAISDILRACTLSPLHRATNLSEAARCLGTHWSKLEDAVDEE